MSKDNNEMHQLIVSKSAGRSSKDLLVTLFDMQRTWPKKSFREPNAVQLASPPG